MSTAGGRRSSAATATISEAADWARAGELYGQLYLDKCSHLNPAYRAQFIEAWHPAGLLKGHGLP